MQNPQTVLLIGASRGLGFGQEWLSRGVDVVATVRGGQTRLHELMAEYKDRLSIEQLEITDPASVEGLHSRLAGHRFDTLFVNAGVALGPGDRIDRVSTEEFCRVMLTNALRPMRIVERLGPLVKDEGTIGVMSSSLGSVALNESGGWEAYRGSKAALNMLMRSYAARHANDKRSLALVDPGWVKTEMGGDDAALSIEDVLDKTIPVFWKHGLAETSVQDLELATGVNKSGLYSEFEDKEDLFVASMRQYLDVLMGRGTLTKQPLGWNNVQNFLKFCYGGWGQKGCFSVNSMREFSDLPAKARQLMVANVMKVHSQLIDNLAAERGNGDDNNSLAGLILTFFSGICLEQNLGPDRARITKKIENFMQLIREI